MKCGWELAELKPQYVLPALKVLMSINPEWNRSVKLLPLRAFGMLSGAFVVKLDGYFL